MNTDEIIVAPGTYFETINFLGKAIWLHGSDGAEVTTIDGTGFFHVVRCVSGEGPNTILDGFTITGGNADGEDFPDLVGGVLVQRVQDDYSGTKATRPRLYRSAMSSPTTARAP